MSIIGHSMQGSVVNVHSVLKEQQAAQVAASDEDAKRQARVQREEELSRESVQESLEAKGHRAEDTTDRGRRRKRSDEAGDGESGEDRHIDVLA